MRIDAHAHIYHGDEERYVMKEEPFRPALAMGTIQHLRREMAANAVDKVVGRLHMDGLLPAGELGLWVSGRASFEMAQKAWAAGFASLVAVSGPSALAVETARTANLQLAGFARGDRLNLYTGD